ncbi:site-specific integrase [Staphylococcus simulans]|uniref:site-specific integrase n=1 Tax=Staphylococcus simulans TaxID=1286 RepID=UPI001E318D9B|nr:site-specific integrase [Staphylococcus simulans]MCD8914178.1 site-specific integrase [Staphylococcus simulans]
MASFEKQKNGKTWRYIISYKDDDGKYKKYQKGGFRTKQEAKIHANEMEYNLKHGFNINNDVIFADYFKQWYEVNKKPHVSAKTLTRYVSMHNHIEKHFKNTFLKDIKPSDYQRFINHYGSNHNIDGVRKLNSSVRNCFHQAIHEGLVLRNPTFKAQLSGGNPSKSEELKFISHTEYKKLKHYLEGKDSVSSLVLLMGLVTGGRFSEIANMKRNDFYIGENKVHLPGTKTTTSDRTISIDTKTLNKVRRFINKRPSDINGYVFTGKNGSVITNASVNKALNNACKKLGIKSITTHALRHTHASVLIHNGYSVQYISKRLGHSSTLVTQSVYLHLLEETYEREDKQFIKFMDNL